MWRPISEAIVEEIPDQKYTGEPVVPKPVVTYMGTELVEGTDYTLRYSDNVKEGKATVVIGGIGDYFGDIAVSFNIVDFESIEDAVFEAIPDQEYTGSVLEPALTASFEGKQLVLGEDFTVVYSNNVEPGTAEVVVAGAGKFVGQKTLTFQIKPKAISAPVAKTDLVYTGEEQEGVLAGEGYTLSGTTSAIRVGSYVVTATLKNGYVWEDGSTVDYVIEWSIGPERSVERPSAVDGLVYNGEAQQGVLPDAEYGEKAYSLGGTFQAVDAGTYEAEVTLNPGYHWADGGYDSVVVTWEIARCPVDVPEGGSFEYTADGSHAVFEHLADADERFAVSGDVEKSEVGTYVALVEPGPNYVWLDGATDSREVAWSITPCVIDFDTLVSKDVVYNGQRQIGVQSGDGYSLTGTLTAVDAGEYFAEATLWDSNYIWSDGASDAKKITWSISPATLTAAYVGEQIAWNEEPLLEVNVTGFVAGEDPSHAAGYVAPCVTAPANWEAGGVYELRPEGGAASNYEFEYVLGTLVVGAVPLTDADISLSSETAPYSGKAQQPAVSVMLDGEKLVEGEDYEVGYEGGFVNAGTYSVVVRGIGICEGEEALEFSILRKALGVSNVTLSYASAVYNGNAKKPAITVKVNGVKQAASRYTVTYWNKAKTKQVTPKVVGTYWVKVTSKASANTSGAVWKKLVINPKAATGLSLTRLNNGFKAKWTKPSHQVTGYQVSYKRAGTTTWYSKNVVGYKATTKSVTGLKDKKSYQVRVRSYKTVGGVKYYSAWTVVKTVKTS